VRGRAGEGSAKSSDAIGHVTIRLPIPHFLLVLHCDQASISNGFRDIRPQTSFALRPMLNRHCVCAISLDVYPYAKFGYIF